MTFIRPDLSKTYTYADYLHWSGDERYELIDGTPYLMTPAPSRRHQEILFELGRQFGNCLKGTTCKGYIAPFDVRLSEKKGEPDHKVFTVVQPDLVVVCDPSKLDEKGCIGVPDLVVEILSPSTASHDYIRKMNLYEKYGVKEYWIIHPEEQLVMVYILENGQYGRPFVYDRESNLHSKTLSNIEINLKEVFAQ